jgi:hypothetical protein
MARETMDDPSTFDALLQCGHRSPEDVLPASEVTSFLAFRLADGDFKEQLWIEANCDEVEITRGFAMKRTEIYLATEKK